MYALGRNGILMTKNDITARLEKLSGKIEIYYSKVSSFITIDFFLPVGVSPKNLLYALANDA